MIQIPNLYDSLGLSVTASRSEIKKAINRTFRESHPDMNDGVTGPRYAIAQQARETLLDEAKREEYDLEIGVTERSYATSSASSGSNPFQEWQSSGFARSSESASEPPPADSPPPRETWQDHSEAFDFQPERIDIGFSAPVTSPEVYPKGEAMEFPVWAVSTLVLGLCMGITLVLLGLGISHPWVIGITSELANRPELFMSVILRGIGVVIGTLIIYITVFLVRWALPSRGSKGARIFGGAMALLAWLVCSTVGGGFGVLTGLLAVPAAYLSVAWHTHSRAHLIPPRKCESTPVFGKPTVGNGQSDPRGVIASADHLRYLLSIPGTRIFHSVRSPLNEGSVDHVIVRDRTIILVDTRLWPSRHYALGSNGSGGYVVREMSGTATQQHPITVLDTAEHYRMMFPECAVSSWILIQPASGRNNFSVYSADDVPPNLGIGGPQETVNTLGNYLLGQSQPRINREVITRLQTLVRG